MPEELVSGSGWEAGADVLLGGVVAGVGWAAGADFLLAGGVVGGGTGAADFLGAGVVAGCGRAGILSSSDNLLFRIFLFSGSWCSIGKKRRTKKLQYISDIKSSFVVLK
jgi:hypothetical protein